MERQYCISACFQWVSTHMIQYYMIPKPTYGLWNPSNCLSDMSLFLSRTIWEIVNGKTILHHCMFPVGLYAYLAMLNIFHTNIKPLESQYQLIQWLQIS